MSYTDLTRGGAWGADWEVGGHGGLYYSGKTKMIGISNVTADQLIELAEQANLKPMVCRTDASLRSGGTKRRDICQAHGIIYQGFSLLTANRRVLLIQKFGQSLNG